VYVPQSRGCTYVTVRKSLYDRKDCGGVWLPNAPEECGCWDWQTYRDITISLCVTSSGFTPSKYNALFFSGRKTVGYLVWKRQSILSRRAVRPRHGGVVRGSKTALPRIRRRGASRTPPTFIPSGPCDLVAIVWARISRGDPTREFKPQRLLFTPADSA
jgi:hypothetical protein